MLQRIWQSNLTGYFIIGGIILFALCVCSSSLYGYRISHMFDGFAPSCTIGVGTATITVTAWSAHDDCAAMLSGPNNFSNVDWSHLASPRSEPNTNGPVICEFDEGDRHVTVRDNGDTGGVLCGMLDNGRFGTP